MPKNAGRAQAASVPTPSVKPESPDPGIEIDLERTKPSIKHISDKDAEIYNKIFALQYDGHFSEAKALSAELNDNRLYGHVLFQRYLHDDYVSTFDELADWLAHYDDHPGAYRIYRLAQIKGGDRAASLKKPETSINIIRRHEPTMSPSKTYRSSRRRNQDEQNAIKDLNRRVIGLIRKDRPTTALGLLNKPENAQTLDAVEYDVLRAHIAASYLYNAKLQKARELAEQSIARSGLYVPRAGWVAGLASWIQKDYDAASRHFELVGRSSYASGWTRTAGAYWAARAHMRTGNVKAVSTWLDRAVTHPRTFYGLVGTRALGVDFDFNWDVPTFTKDYYKLLAATPEGYRAMALLKAGQSKRAEAELLRMDVENPVLFDALLAYANYAHLPGLAMRLGASMEGPEEGRYYDAALYPMGPWQPLAGYTIDPALIHAIMRQESRFDPGAESASGARGLMQIMPRTAKAVAKEDVIRLDDPHINMELGQQYLQKLLNGERYVQKDLLRLLIAYNAGPGNLRKWSKRWPDVTDPLLFIELIPSAETRGYVEKVLANYWIYRLRGGLPTPTLDAVTAGKPAIYAVGAGLPE